MKIMSMLYVIIGLIIGSTLTLLITGNQPSVETAMPETTDHTVSHTSSSEPMSMDSMMTDMNTSLRGKTGEEFDKAFIEEMIIHHQGAIDMANLALENAQHEEIKNLSKDIITAQTKEIDLMKAWQETWGYTNTY